MVFLLLTLNSQLQVDLILKTMTAFTNLKRWFNIVQKPEEIHKLSISSNTFLKSYFYPTYRIVIIIVDILLC